MIYTVEEIQEKLKELSHWEHKDKTLYGKFEFEDFKEAFAAMTRIAFEAEQLQHHPEWTNIYNTVEIKLTTHDAGEITSKDFALAEKIDAVIKN